MQMQTGCCCLPFSFLLLLTIFSVSFSGLRSDAVSLRLNKENQIKGIEFIHPTTRSKVISPHNGWCLLPRKEKIRLLTSGLRSYAAFDSFNYSNPNPDRLVHQRWCCDGPSGSSHRALPLLGLVIASIHLGLCPSATKFFYRWVFFQSFDLIKSLCACI